jgi:hypothetical protein
MADLAIGGGGLEIGDERRSGSKAGGGGKESAAVDHGSVEKRYGMGKHGLTTFRLKFHSSI